MTKMHVDKPKLDDMDLMKDDGILSRLQFMINDEVSSDPPTPPEPEHFFDDSEAKTNESVDYYALLLKSRSSTDISPLASHSSIPNFLLGPPPTQSSSSSRDPSPNNNNTTGSLLAESPENKQIKRRYVPFSQNRKYQRKPTIEPILCSRSVEDFRFGGLLTGAETRRSRCSPTPQAPSSPLNTFPIKSQGSVLRKVSSIRRRAGRNETLDDQETSSYSSDEMSNLKERIHCNKLKKSLSGSLPTIVADAYCKQGIWRQSSPNETPSNSNPLLNKNMISSTVGLDIGSDADFQVLRVPTIGTADTSSENSAYSDKINEPPQSAPPLSNNESLFVFERRKSLIQELPAISEDQLVDEINDTWHSANDTTNEFNNSDGYLHKRSTSDYVADKPLIERRSSEKLIPTKMKIISGNPNFSDNDDSLKIDAKSTSNGVDKNRCKNGTSLLDCSSDFADSFGRQKASSLVLQQDGSKTLQLVETKSDYSELKKPLCSKDLTDSIPHDLPEQGTRKARILKRKTKLKRHKSSLRAVQKGPISCAVDHISPSLLKNAEAENTPIVSEEPPPVVVLRKDSVQLSLSRKRSGTDKPKKENKPKIFSLFGSTRIKERKDSRAIFHNDPQNGSSSLNNKRFSLAESMLSCRNSTDVLPDSLAFLTTTSSETDLKNGSLSSYSSVDNSQWPQLQKKKWADLELWIDEPGTWSERFPEIKLTTGEEKRQNIIYEFYTTEKRHCQVLVLIQQIWQVGLLRHNILTDSEIKALIPDVIDSLLDFHLKLLRSIRQRIFEDSVVSTISDVVYDVFKNSENRAAAIKAYTDFCLSRDSSDLCYNEFINKNANFRLFCENLDQFPASKKRNFKSCFLLIIQRLTKYPSLIEQIIKYESNPENKLSGQRALTAVRNFALRVDRELSCQLLNRRFEQVRSMIDRNSIGRVLGQKFTFDDLILGEEDEFHKILSIGTVQWKGLNNQSFELTMLLFDDIIVFLQNKNNSLQFFSHKDHASVLPLHATLVREMPRSNMIMLIVVAVQQTPDMYQLQFSSRNEMEQWLSALNTAQKIAPKYVRMANRKLFVKGNAKSSDVNDEEESEEERYNLLLTKWQDKLDSIFLNQMNGESKLLQYMEERMQFLDEVRKHLIAFPFRPHPESQGSVPSTVKSRDARELNKMKTLLNSHFAELRSVRRNQLDRLVGVAQKSRDHDLTSFFDDLHEIGHPSNGESTTFSSSSDESRPSTSKPRRVKTWNMGNIETHQSDIVRRHTTVPKFSQQPGCSTSEQQEMVSQQIDERLRKFSLSTNSKARRAATELIRENVALRIENDRLRSENALNGIHLAALRGRKAAFETTEKLEVLRQKKEEVQAKELEFKKEYEKRLKELTAREQELELKEAELKERERQCGKENLSYELGDMDSINSSGISRDTSFRSGAVIFNSSSSIPIQTSRSSGDVVLPKHLAETKEKRAKK